MATITKTIGIKPLLGEPSGENVTIPVALFGVIGECAGIHDEPFFIVNAGSKRPSDKAVGRAMLWRERQVATHVKQRGIESQTMRCSKALLVVSRLTYEPAH